MKTSSISHECAVNLVGVLLQELAHPPRNQREQQQLNNLFTELECETCNGHGQVRTGLGEEELDECPDCGGHAFTVPTDCYCCNGTGEDAGHEPCLYCRGQHVRTESKEWS